MNATLTAVRLKPPVLRFVVIGSITIAILSLLLWIERDFDRGFVLAHNPLRDSPPAVALCGAFSRFGMSAISQRTSLGFAFSVPGGGGATQDMHLRPLATKGQTRKEKPLDGSALRTRGQ